MNENQLKKEINILRTKYNFLKRTDLRGKEDYEWLLIEVRAEVADNNFNLSYLSVVAFLMSVVAILFTVMGNTEITPILKSIMNIFLIIILIITVILSIKPINSVTINKNKTRELKKLEEIIVLYLK